MKNKIPAKQLSRLLLAAAVFLHAGCSTPVAVQGDYSTPQATVTGVVTNSTNGVTVGATFQTGTTNVGGSVTVGK